VARFPADIKAPVQYGKHFRALLTYHYDAQLHIQLPLFESGGKPFPPPSSHGQVSD
jgi:hypothetical protein